MAKFGRRRKGNWRFSDRGNRFDGRKPRPRTIGEPISPALRRGLRRCKRCGSRVVSNVDHCPYCGKTLLPVVLRLWFWLIVVVVLGISVFFIVYKSIPNSLEEIHSPALASEVTVIGAPESSIKDLALGTAVDLDGLETSVISLEEGPQDSNGQPLRALNIEFVNNSSSTVTLYSTQWRLQLADGTRIDAYIGGTIDGVTVMGNFEAYELPADGRFTGRLYFSGADITAVVYQPTPLSYEEDLLVTWTVTESTP